MDLLTRARRDLPANFWTNLVTGNPKVEVTPSGCWQWLGGMVNGYGQYNRRRSGGGYLTTLAHRFAYESLIGELPVYPDQLDHLCRNRGCVNPAHLEPVSARVNTLRGDTIAAAYASRETCKNGHPLVPENVYMPTASKPSRARICKACNRANARAQRERAKEKGAS